MIIGDKIEFTLSFPITLMDFLDIIRSIVIHLTRSRDIISAGLVNKQWNNIFLERESSFWETVKLYPNVGWDYKRVFCHPSATYNRITKYIDPNYIGTTEWKCITENIATRYPQYIDEHPEIDWDLDTLITLRSRGNIDYLVEHCDPKLDWKRITPMFSIETIVEYPELFWDRKHVLRTITPELVDKINIKNHEMPIFFSTNTVFTFEQMLDKFGDRIGYMCYQSNPNIDVLVVKRHPKIRWNIVTIFESLGIRSNRVLSDVEKEFWVKYQKPDDPTYINHVQYTCDLLYRSDVYPKHMICNKNLDWDYVLDNLNYDWNWFALIAKSNITADIVYRIYDHDPTIFSINIRECLMMNIAIPISTIIESEHPVWAHYMVAARKDLTEEIILKYPNFNWHSKFYYPSRNCNISWEFIEKQNMITPNLDHCHKYIPLRLLRSAGKWDPVHSPRCEHYLNHYGD